MDRATVELTVDEWRIIVESMAKQTTDDVQIELLIHIVEAVRQQTDVRVDEEAELCLISPH